MFLYFKGRKWKLMILVVLGLLFIRGGGNGGKSKTKMPNEYMWDS